MARLVPQKPLQKNEVYSRTRFFIELGLSISISAMFVLLMGVFRIPASIPIFFLSYRRNPKIAMICGIVVGYLILIIKPLIIHPIVFIEAPLEYLCIGLSGFFPMNGKKYKNGAIQWAYERRGIFLGATLRFLVTLAGSYIIYSYYFQASGKIIWFIALLDEGPIFIPYLIFCLLLIPYIVKYHYEVHELK